MSTVLEIVQSDKRKKHMQYEENWSKDVVFIDCEEQSVQLIAICNPFAKEK